MTRPQPPLSSRYGEAAHGKTATGSCACKGKTVLDLCGEVESARQQ